MAAPSRRILLAATLASVVLPALCEYSNSSMSPAMSPTTMAYKCCEVEETKICEVGGKGVVWSTSSTGSKIPKPVRDRVIAGAGVAVAVSQPSRSDVLRGVTSCGA